MKPTMLATCLAGVLTLLPAVPSVCAQGTVLFDTHTMGVDAQFHDNQCEPLDGDKWVAQLWVDESGSSFVPLGQPVPFGTGTEAGYVNGSIVEVAGRAPFTSVSMKVRYWRKEFATFEQGQASGEEFGESPEVQVTLGSPEHPGSLLNLGPMWGGCERGVKLQVQLKDSDVELYWTYRFDAPVYLVVPQQAGSPAGPWQDIDGPWLPSTNPPNPLILPKPADARFYRFRLTTGTAN